MGEPFQYFGGIDFSGAKEPLSNLWTAVGTEEGGKLHILALRPHPFRADLGAYVAGGWHAGIGATGEDRILWGADFPFGLPAAAAAHLPGAPGSERSRWAEVLAWVADRPPDEVRDTVPDAARLLRATDTGGALPPFDLRLYKQTAEGLRWLHGLRETTSVSIHPQFPDEHAACTLVEVYPSSTSRELGLPRRRTPARPGEVRARCAALRTYLSFADPSLEATAATLEDAWDATLACLTVWLARDDLDQPFRATDQPRALLELEGWIYRPPATIA